MGSAAAGVVRQFTRVMLWHIQIMPYSWHGCCVLPIIQIRTVQEVTADAYQASRDAVASQAGMLVLALHAFSVVANGDRVIFLTCRYHLLTIIQSHDEAAVDPYEALEVDAAAEAEEQWAASMVGYIICCGKWRLRSP